MAFDLDVGGGSTVTVSAPDRETYSDNLSGALQFMVANGLYRILELTGSAFGAFGAGVAVQFMDRIEPSLVEYAAPIIDVLLASSDLDTTLRDFLTKLREPTHAGAAAILGGMGSQIGGAIVGSTLASLTAGLTYSVNRSNRPALPSLTDALAMERRGVPLDHSVDYIMQSLGYHDDYITGYREITQGRAGLGDLIGSFKRGLTHEIDVRAELVKRGVAPDSIELLIRNAEEILDVGSIIQAWQRDIMSSSTMRAMLQNRQFSNVTIDMLKELSHPIPGPSDLVSMGVREAWRDDIAALWGYDKDSPPELAENMAKHGYDPEWAKRYWRAHWTLPSAGQAFEMLHRGTIDAAELQTLLRALDIPSRWRDALTDIAWTPYTRVDVRRMYGLGVLDEDAVRDSYKALGYDPEKAENMTQFTLLYENSDGTSKIDEYKELTRSVVIQAFVKGILDKAEATTRLMGIGYEQVDIDIMLELASWTKELSETPDYETEYAKDVKSIIEKAYSRRLLSHTEAVNSLTDLGYGDTEAEYLLSSVDFWYGFESLNSELKAVGDAYVSRAYNRTDTVSALGTLGVPSNMQDQVLGDLDTERKHRSRRLTEAQYRRALGQELLTADEYAEAMRGLGYSDSDVWLLVNMAAGSESAGSKPRTGEYL